MSNTAVLYVALLVTIAGMACFALSVDAHWRQLFSEWPHPRVLRVGLRLVGALLLTAAFWLCTVGDPVSMAVLVWTMLLTVAAALVAAGLTLHARLRAGMDTD